MPLMLSEIILNVSKLRFAHLDILKSSKVSIPTIGNRQPNPKSLKKVKRRQRLCEMKTVVCIIMHRDSKTIDKVSVSLIAFGAHEKVQQ